MEPMVIKTNRTFHQVYVLGQSEAPVPQKITVERDAKADIVVLIPPGVSCDLRMDVSLAGEGAQANIYGAYICAGQEKVKIAVDMHSSS